MKTIIKKCANDGDFVKVQLVGNLGDAHRCLAQEEEDLYWSQGTLEMIENIGAQNWLITQM